MALDITLLRPEIGNMNNCFYLGEASKRDVRFVVEEHDWFPLPEFLVSKGRFLHSNDMKGIVAVGEQVAKFGLTYLHCVL